MEHRNNPTHLNSASSTFFWIPITWGLNPFWGQFLLVGQALLLDLKPAWRPSFSSGTQTYYRAQIPYRGHILFVDP